MKNIIDQAIAGNGEALRNIYESYKKPIYYFCSKLMPTPDDADEMCAQTFDCAFARLETLENPDQFDIWLKNIAAIRCFNYIHKMKPMLFLQAVADTEESLFSMAEMEKMPKGEQTETLTCQIMDRMIDRLNDAQRMTLMFHYYNNLSVVQIAKIMSCTADIVKQRMNKAAEHMKNTVSHLTDKGILLNQLDFRSVFTIMSACQTVPQLVDAQVEGIILSITKEQVQEDTPTPQYNFENFAPRSSSEESADEETPLFDNGEPQLTQVELSSASDSSEKKETKLNAVLHKIKQSSSMQQSIALVVIVAIVASIIIGVGIGKKKKNPDMVAPSTVSSTSSVASETSSVEVVIPKYELELKSEQQELKATDGKVVAKASYQYPVAELTDSTGAALKINEYFNSEKDEILSTYSGETTKAECIYGYENKPHGSWKLNTTEVEMKPGKVDKASVNLLKTKTEFKYGNMYSQSEAEGYCFSTTTGERLKIEDVLEDVDSYISYASDKIKDELNKNQTAGKYNLYEDYSSTVKKVLKKEGRWYFTDDGITVIFNPDEVVYITLGVQTFNLPMAEINDFLKEEYKN